MAQMVCTPLFLPFLPLGKQPPPPLNLPQGAALPPMLPSPLGIGIGVDVPSGTACLSGPVAILLPFEIMLLAIALVLGVLWGRYALRKRITGRLEADIANNASLSDWRYQRTSGVLSFLLIIGGFCLFLIGATGQIELDIKYAKIVTSLPGVVVILLGYLTWTRSRPAK